MGPIMMTQLVSALTRQLTQMSRLTLHWSSPTTSMYRCLSTLSSAPSRRLLMPDRDIALQALPPGACAQDRGSILGQCQHLACLQPSAGMKTKSSLKRRCKDCFFVHRRGRLFVFCKTHPRHKQRQG